ncbi:MAG: NAD-binding protein [Candidatus Methanomethylophilaceae archaeon]|nr:NAD-binding protein [Candidatus Methanomethylophilaceae archaeon]MBR4202122.1 NAD-binding protein [Candidatus Methanomethylophilaceae archaeon]
MKVIIIGAGSIGYVAAETISDMHDVLIVEDDAALADIAKNRLNVSVLHEDGTNPKTLEQAIQTHKAEVIISTLEHDDSNLFICMMAKRIKPEIRTVASITNPDYIISTTEQGVPGVDIIISPELLTAEKMYKLCVLENALDYEIMPVFKSSMAVFQVPPESNLVGKVVMFALNSIEATAFAIYRNDDLFFQVDSMEIHAGDRICIMGSENAIDEFNELLGIENISREIIILGGTIVGRHLAKLLAEDQKKRYVKIIEKNQDVCKDLFRILTGVLVVNGDFTEPNLQSSENIFRSDCLVSVTNQDDTNLLMCMSAQKYNTNKIISRYLKKEYMDIFMFTGLDTIIGFDRIVSNEIAKCVMSNDNVVMRMRNREEQFFIHDVNKQSKLIDKYFGDVVMPNGLSILGIYRDGSILYPMMDTKFIEGDRVMVFTNFTKEKDLAKVFGRKAISES